MIDFSPSADEVAELTRLSAKDELEHSWDLDVRFPLRTVVIGIAESVAEAERSSQRWLCAVINNDSYGKLVLEPASTVPDDHKSTKWQKRFKSRCRS